MIQTIVTHTCPKCGSENMVRNGHDYKGDQKYYCKTCASYGTLHAQQRYDERTHDQVKRAVLERISLRGIERSFGISRRTVADWIEDWADHLPSLDTTLAGAQ
jgi:transposase-like protein